MIKPFLELLFFLQTKWSMIAYDDRRQQDSKNLQIKNDIILYSNHDNRYQNFSSIIDLLLNQKFAESSTTGLIKILAGWLTRFSGRALSTTTEEIPLKSTTRSQSS
jgi:hypothetical protein